MSFSERHTSGARLSAAAIVFGMVIGSLALWIGNPALWFWLTARLQSTQPSMGPYALLLVGILATAIVCAKLLAALNRRYAVVMVLSVVVAAIAIAAWFIIVNPSPPGVEPGGFKD